MVKHEVGGNLHEAVDQRIPEVLVALVDARYNKLGAQ